MENDGSADCTRHIAQHLHWLKKEVEVRPSPWAYGRIAHLEGLLAGYREQAAWEETRRIFRRLTGK